MLLVKILSKNCKLGTFISYLLLIVNVIDSIQYYTTRLKRKRNAQHKWKKVKLPGDSKN